MMNPAGSPTGAVEQLGAGDIRCWRYVPARRWLVTATVVLWASFTLVPAAAAAGMKQFRVEPTSATAGNSITATSIDPCSESPVAERFVMLAIEAPTSNDAGIRAVLNAPLGADGSWSASLTPPDTRSGVYRVTAVCSGRAQIGSYKDESFAVGAQGNGYYELADDGSVYSFGDAFPYYYTYGRGPRGSVALVNRPRQSDGYWIAGADGSVYALGEAQFYGSASNFKLSSAVAGMAATPSGNGYWLAGTDGGEYSHLAMPAIAALHRNSPSMPLSLEWRQPATVTDTGLSQPMEACSPSPARCSWGHLDPSN